MAFEIGGSTDCSFIDIYVTLCTSSVAIESCFIPAYVPSFPLICFFFFANTCLSPPFFIFSFLLFFFLFLLVWSLIDWEILTSLWAVVWVEVITVVIVRTRRFFLSGSTWNNMVTRSMAGAFLICLWQVTCTKSTIFPVQFRKIPLSALIEAVGELWWKRGDWFLMSLPGSGQSERALLWRNQL